MAQNAVWGLDIGNSAVKAVKMIRLKDEARIEDFDIIDIFGGDEDADRGSRVQSALKTLCANHQFKNDPVYISLPGDKSIFKDFMLPPGSEKRIEELVQFESRQHIARLDEVELGWEQFEDPSGGGAGVELVAVKKTDIREMLAITKEFGLNVQGVSVAPIALFNFIKFEYQPEGTTLVLDTGYKGTDFVVMEGRHIHSRTIPIGGREITRSLETKFKVSYPKAEELKKNVAQSKQADRIMTVIEPTLRQLGADILRTVGFYKSKSRAQRITQGYLLGHTFRLPNMAEMLAAQVREAPFSIVEGLQRIQLAGPVNPGVFTQEFPTMTVAIGLGLQGLGLSELRVNLLPREVKAQITVSRKKWWGLVSAAALLAALAVSYHRSGVDAAAAARLEAGSTENLNRTQIKQADLQKAQDALPAEELNVRRLTRAARDRGRLAEIFTSIVGLKDADGKPFFGEDRKVYLSNLYISRTPFTFGEGGHLNTADPSWNNWRQEMLPNSNYLKPGERCFYTRLKDARIKPEDPYELRPDVPLVVILSGESEGNSEAAATDKLDKLSDALRRVPGVTEIRDVTDRQVRTRKETRMELLDNGQVNPSKDKAPVEGPEVTYLAFHLLSRWNAENDKDMEPAPAGKPAKPGS